MKTISLLLLVLGLAGCYTSQPRPAVELEEIYREALGKGASDHVAVVNQEIRTSPASAGTDVFIPLRQRAWIVEAYVPDHVNANGDHVRGHYVDLVIEPERWASPAFHTEMPARGTSVPSHVPVVYEEK